MIPVCKVLENIGSRNYLEDAGQWGRGFEGLQSPLLSLFLVRNEVTLLPPYILILSLVSVLQLTKCPAHTSLDTAQAVLLAAPCGLSGHRQIFPQKLKRLDQRVCGLRQRPATPTKGKMPVTQGSVFCLL